MGTKNKKNNDIKNNRIDNVKSIFLFKEEKKTKINIPKHIYIKCLKKKK
jgi:hypothetical protein